MKTAWLLITTCCTIFGTNNDLFLLVMLLAAISTGLFLAIQPKGKTMKKILLIAFLSISSMAIAGGVYFGVGAINVDTDLTDHQAIMINGGYRVNDYVEFGASVMFYSSDEDYQGAVIDIDRYSTAHVSLSLPLGDSVSPYILAGYADGEFTASYGGYSESVSDSGTYYGAGIRFDLREAWSVNVEYAKPFDDISTLGVSLRHNF